MKLSLHLDSIEIIVPGMAGLMTRLDRIDSALAIILKKGTEMSAQLDTLKAEVEQTKTVAASAVTLIQGLAAQIIALKEDPAALEALATELSATTDALAAAVSANTTPPAS